MIHERFHVVSRFPLYILCYIAENWLYSITLGAESDPAERAGRADRLPQPGPNLQATMTTCVMKQTTFVMEQNTSVMEQTTFVME